MYGGFLGFGIGNFTLTGEYDIAKDLTTNNASATAVMVERDLSNCERIEHCYPVRPF